jgi:hypothetical protein
VVPLVLSAQTSNEEDLILTKWLRRGMVAAVLAGGLATAGASAASGTGSTSDNTGLLNGNQIDLPIQVPVDVCGNAVGVLGTANASCEGGATATNSGSGGGGNTSSGNLGAANGNQVNAPIQIPISACGNAVGNASASCKGGAAATNSGSGGGNTTSGNLGLLNGNQVDLPVQVPISACGNAVAVLGTAQAWCVGGASANNPGGGGKKGTGGVNTSSGNVGIGNGNQVTAPIQVPINVCGNAAAVLGSAAASCVGGATANPPGGGCPDQVTSGNLGLLTGNQICAPIQVPINVCGNAVGVAGSAEASCVAAPPVKAAPPAPSLPITGFSVGLPLGLAAVLLIGGSAAVFLGRRRQSRHTSA